MPRLCPVKPDKLKAVLKRNGHCVLSGRGGGSHGGGVMRDPNHSDRFTVVPDYDEISVDLLRRILHEAKKPREEYQRVLREV